MRLAPCLLALAALAAAGAVRAEPTRLTCSGLITDPESRSQAKNSGVFELTLDPVAKAVLVDGRPAGGAAFTEATVSFSPPHGKPRGAANKLLGKVGAGRDQLLGAKSYEYELDRRTGFWKTRGASGVCRKPQSATPLF